jgi:hypothetical protein
VGVDLVSLSFASFGSKTLQILTNWSPSTAMVVPISLTVHKRQEAMQSITRENLYLLSSKRSGGIVKAIVLQIC